MFEEAYNMNIARPGAKINITMPNGRVVDPYDFEVDQINIQTMARALSNNCRFNGHTNKFFSVAAHTIMVSRLACTYKAMDASRRNQLRLACLVHDSSEAIISDIAAPFKKTLLNYLEVERKIEYEMYRGFGVEETWINDEEFMQDLKYLDQAALSIEASRVMGCKIGNGTDFLLDNFIKDRMNIPMHEGVCPEIVAGMWILELSHIYESLEKSNKGVPVEAYYKNSNVVRDCRDYEMLVKGDAYLHDGCSMKYIICLSVKEEDKEDMWSMGIKDRGYSNYSKIYKVESGNNLKVKYVKKKDLLNRMGVYDYLATLNFSY